MVRVPIMLKLLRLSLFCLTSHCLFTPCSLPYIHVSIIICKLGLAIKCYYTTIVNLQGVCRVQTDQNLPQLDPSNRHGTCHQRRLSRDQVEERQFLHLFPSFDFSASTRRPLTLAEFFARKMNSLKATQLYRFFDFTHAAQVSRNRPYE